jgi:hypothetical protein
VLKKDLLGNMETVKGKDDEDAGEFS